MWVMIRAGREKPAFIAQALFLVLGVTSIFTNVYPNVMPSTVDPAFSLTVGNASSSDYTLTVMLIVAVIFVPIVLTSARNCFSPWRTPSSFLTATSVASGRDPLNTDPKPPPPSGP